MEAVMQFLTPVPEVPGVAADFIAREYTYNLFSGICQQYCRNPGELSEFGNRDVVRNLLLASGNENIHGKLQ